MKLPDDEWQNLRERYVAWLNHFEHDPELSLASDYFYDHEVHMDERWYGMYRFLGITLLTDDEGGPTMLFIHCWVRDDGTTDFSNLENIEHASYTFDSTTSVWIESGKEA